MITTSRQLLERITLSDYKDRFILKGGKAMNTFFYEVAGLDGDYANLKRTDMESDELKLVARALLPPEIMEGTKLKYEWMQYEIINE